jgi:two-component system, sensor histidine kinase and response regulator
MKTSVKDRPWSYVLAEPTKILVVDDDPILFEFASVYLSSPAAQVETAAHVDGALALMQNQSFDIALIDIEMPGRDGYDLLKILRADARTANLPIMMLTGREDIASIDLSYELGATAFTTKPVNWRQLSYQIRYLLRSARTEETLRRQLARQEMSGPALAAQDTACVG